MYQFKSLLLLIAGVLITVSVSAEDTKSVEVDVNESQLEWLGKKVTGEHNGHIKLESGSLEFANNKLTGGTFKIDMRTITNEDLKDETYNKKLVNHLKSDDFFGVEKHQFATLEIKKATHVSGDKYKIDAYLTIKGITNPISFESTVKQSSNTINATADITVDRSKFDVRYGSGSFFEGLGDKMIYDDFVLSVELKADASSL